LLYGSGEGTYSVGGDGLVNLDWRPQGGQAQQFTGPVPAEADPYSPGRRRARKALLAVSAIYLASTAAAFLLGYSLASGSSARRVVIGAFAAVGGYFVAYVVMVSVVGVIRVRRGSRSAP
jgi:hypothetical protein